MIKLLFKLSGVLLIVSVVQAGSIATIQLQSRPAEEVIPIVEPMLAHGDAISGRGFNIFLRSSPDTLAQVKDMIETIDIPAKVLQISVYQGSTQGLSKLDIGGSVQIESGDASADIGTGRNDYGDAGSGITYRTNKGSANLYGISTQTRLNDNPIHQIRVNEGNEAYIETGAEIPYFSSAHWIFPRRAVGAIDYKDVVTGFYVRPRIHGDSITLQVSPFMNAKSDADGGSIETQSAYTSISGRIGEWLLIGGVTEQLNRTQSSTGGRYSTQIRNNESIWIRADLVR